MSKINKESGRSMVEMLGIIAVIGILTIGGVIGYEKAQNSIGLNKLSETMNLFALSFEDQKTIYESLREADGTFGDKIVETTELFAKTYGIKYANRDLIVDNENGWGIPLGGALYFKIRPTDISQKNTRELLAYVISIKDGGKDSFQIREDALRRIQENIRSNPSLRKRFYSLLSNYGHHSFMDKADRLDKSDKRFDITFDSFSSSIKGDYRFPDTLYIQFFYP